MASDGWVWCPECHKWVPEDKMVYGDVPTARVCEFCLDGTSDDNNYVKDDEHGCTRCIYCDSYNTTEQAPNWNVFKCNDCGAQFRRM